MHCHLHLIAHIECTLVSTGVYHLCVCTAIGKYSTCFITIFKPDRQNMPLNRPDKDSSDIILKYVTKYVYSSQHI